MGKGKRTMTEKLLDAVELSEETKCPHFPAEFLLGLRGALEAGLTGEEVVALLILFSGIYEASARMDGEELIDRVRRLSIIIKSDISIEEESRLRIEKNREWRKRMERERKFRKKLRGRR